MVAKLSCRSVLEYINLLKMKISVLICLFVCLWFFVPLEIELFFTHLETSQLQVKATNFDLYLAFMAIEE